MPDAFALVLWLKTDGAGSFDAHHGNDDRMRARHFRLKKASSVLPKDTFSSPVCLIVLMIDAAVTWKAEIRTYFAAWWIYIPPTLAFTLRFLCSSRSLFHSDWYCQGLCRMRSERVITVMASVGEFASGRPKRRRACVVATSGTSIVAGHHSLLMLNSFTDQLLAQLDLFEGIHSLQKRSPCAVQAPARMLWWLSSGSLSCFSCLSTPCCEPQ